MSKALLVEEIANKTDESKTNTAELLDSLLQAIQTLVAKDETVAITGFGAFSKTHRKARKGKNPQTGAEIQIKASNSPHFKAGKGFKETVN